MNKTLLALAIFAFCLTQYSLSTDTVSGNSERELASVPLGNLKDAIGNLIKEAIANKKNETKTENPVFTVPNNTQPNPPTNGTNNTQPNPPTNSTNNTQPAEPVEPTTPDTNNTTPNPTEPINPSNPSENNTNNTNSTNPTTPDEPVTPTEPVEPVEPTEPETPTEPAPVVKYARNDVNMATFKADALNIHNRERAAVGVPPLVWADDLAKHAQDWAVWMSLYKLKHSGKYGENIASSTYSTKVFSRLINMWVNEKNHFIPGCKYPNCSKSSAQVGHYTQMVWRKTTQVGCGFAPGINKQWNYICCRYRVGGNVIGQRVY